MFSIVSFRLLICEESSDPMMHWVPDPVSILQDRWEHLLRTDFLAERSSSPNLIPHSHEDKNGRDFLFYFITKYSAGIALGYKLENLSVTTATDWVCPGYDIHLKGPAKGLKFSSA